MEPVSTDSESDAEEVAELQLMEETNEMERKRRKQAESTPPSGM